MGSAQMALHQTQWAFFLKLGDQPLHRTTERAYHRDLPRMRLIFASRSLKLASREIGNRQSTNASFLSVPTVIMYNEYPM